MLKIGIVGVGFMGKMHGNVYRKLDNAQLVGCVSKKEETRRRYADEFGINAYDSLEAMVAAEDVDAIDICLPTYLHKEFTVAAAAMRKHVFCEKPMAMDTAEADAMTEAAAKNGIQLMIGHCIRFWPEYAILKQMVVSGQLGRLLSANFTRYGAFPTWSSDNWLADASKAGGGVLDMHIHDTDFAHYLLGKPDSINSWGTMDDRGPSHVFTTMTFGPTVVHLEGGWNLPAGTPFKHAFRAIFERGVAIMDGGPLTVYEEGKDPMMPEVPKMQATGGGNISDLGGYYYELKYFVDNVLAGKALEVVTPTSSRDSLEMTLEEIRQIKSRAS